MADLRQATMQRMCNCGNLPYVECQGQNNGYMPPIMPPAMVVPNGISGGGVTQYPSKDNFPTTGNPAFIYIDSESKIPYVWDGNKYVPLNIPKPEDDGDDDKKTGADQYESAEEFPAEGVEGKLYIDKDGQAIYYWDGERYVKVVGASESGSCCDDDDDCCIWGDILNGGGPEDISTDCPIEHHCCGGSGSGSNVLLTKDSIVEALGYTPANKNALDKEVADRKAADADLQKAADAVDTKLGNLEKQMADNKKEIGKVAKDVEAVRAKVDDFENSLKDVDGEITKVQQAIEDMQDAIEEQIGASTWELLQIVELTKDETQIAFNGLKCRKVYASCTICGSDENDTHQRLEIRLNENNTKHRIATLERAVPASSRDIRYTNLYVHALNTNRVGGYVQKDSDYPDTNFILQALSTRSAKNEEISFGTEINDLYFTTGSSEGKLGRGTKIVLYGIKSQE